MNDTNNSFQNFLKGPAWSMVVLRGILSAILGIIFLFNPVSAITTLMMVLGAFLLFNGIMTVVAGLNQHHGKKLLLFYGILSILAGITIFLQPILVEVVIVLLIAFWAIFTGVSQIILAFSGASDSPAKTLIGIVGVISLIFGIAVVSQPQAGLTAIAWIIGLYLLIYGLFSILLGILIRKTGKFFS
jgi:uncharacterized membrane protein HdeD (DUF308 family)